MKKLLIIFIIIATSISCSSEPECDACYQVGNITKIRDYTLVSTNGEGVTTIREMKELEYTVLDPCDNTVKTFRVNLPNDIQPLSVEVCDRGYFNQ